MMAQTPSPAVRQTERTASPTVSCTSGVSVGYFVLLRVVSPGMAVPLVSVWGIL